MKKHYPFERRKTKLVLASALATMAVCQFVSCSEYSEIPELPTTTLSTTYSAEVTTEETTLPQTTTAVQPETSNPKSETTLSIPEVTTPLETTTEAPIETTTETPIETTTETTTMTPVVRTERTEETESIPYDTIYEYSSMYYEGTSTTRRAGKNGKLLRVTVTVFEDDVPLDATVTETVIAEPVSRIVVIGTKSTISYGTVSVKEDVVPFETEIRKDDSRYDDEETVIQEGIDGYTEAVYRITYEKGIEVSRICASRTVMKPQNKIVSVGTKPAWTEKTVMEQENTVPYQTEYIYDNTVEDGKRIVKTKGLNGYTSCEYRYRYYKGTFSSRELVSSTVYEPRTEVVIIGTKKEESFVLPFRKNQGYYLSQDYSSSHQALDFAIWYGDPIFAVKGGTVIHAYDEGYFSKNDPNWTYGTFVMIEHENGVRSLYAHLKSRTVSIGDKVSAGQTIGYSGNTGRVNPMPTPADPLAGTHLHFEIRIKKNGSYVKVDPKDYIPDF